MLRMEGCSPRSLVSRMFLYIDVVIMLLVIHTICQDMIEVFRFMQWWTESLRGLTQEEEKLQREKTVALAREKLVQDSLKRPNRGEVGVQPTLQTLHVSTCNLNVFMRMQLWAHAMCTPGRRRCKRLYLWWRKMRRISRTSSGQICPLSSLKCLKMSKFYTFSQMQRAANKFLEKQTGTSDWVMNLQDRIGMLEGPGHQRESPLVLASRGHIWSCLHLAMPSLTCQVSIAGVWAGEFQIGWGGEEDAGRRQQVWVCNLIFCFSISQEAIKAKDAEKIRLTEDIKKSEESRFGESRCRLLTPGSLKVLKTSSIWANWK